MLQLDRASSNVGGTIRGEVILHKPLKATPGVRNALRRIKRAVKGVPQPEPLSMAMKKYPLVARSRYPLVAR